MFLIGHLDVEHVRPVVVNHFLDRVAQVCLVLDVVRSTAKPFGDGDKIGIALGRAEPVALAGCLGIVDWC